MIHEDTNVFTLSSDGDRLSLPDGVLVELDSNNTSLCLQFPDVTKVHILFIDAVGG